MTTVPLEEDISNSGLKMTGPRRVIARVLAESTDHPDATQLYERVSQEDSSISVATVYRTVKLFEEAGLISRRDFGDGRARYDPITDHHHHIIDVESGKVIEFRNDEIEELKSAIAKEYGYELVECHLELYCRPIGSKAKNTKSSPATSSTESE